MKLPLLISSPTQTVQCCPSLSPVLPQSPLGTLSPWLRAGGERQSRVGERLRRVTLGSKRTSWVLGYLQDDGCFVSFD